MNSQINNNLSMRDAIRLWKQSGGTVEVAYRTGEYVFAHPSAQRFRANCRRKDATRSVIKWLRRIGA